MTGETGAARAGAAAGLFVADEGRILDSAPNIEFVAGCCFGGTTAAGASAGGASATAATTVAAVALARRRTSLRERRPRSALCSCTVDDTPSTSTVRLLRRTGGLRTRRRRAMKPRITDWILVARVFLRISFRAASGLAMDFLRPDFRPWLWPCCRDDAVDTEEEDLRWFAAARDEEEEALDVRE